MIKTDAGRFGGVSRRHSICPQIVGLAMKAIDNKRMRERRAETEEEEEEVRMEEEERERNQERKYEE